MHHQPMRSAGIGAMPEIPGMRSLKRMSLMLEAVRHVMPIR